MMTPSLQILLLWFAFALTHTIFASVPVRPRLVAAVTLRGYLLLYSLIALAIFVFMVRIYLQNLHQGGMPAFHPALLPGVHWLTMALSTIGISIAAAGLFQPSPLTMGVGGDSPRGLSRITRHPLFMGLGLWGLGHLLINPFWTDIAFFGGVAIYSLLGSMHQDYRKRATQAHPDSFFATTSLLPFGAILARRNKLVWSELPWLGLTVGLAVSIALYLSHDYLFRS